MSSIGRRAGSKLFEFIRRTSDPGQSVKRVKLYGKEDNGVTQLFAQDSSGAAHQLTPASSGGGGEIIPEIWSQNNVAASQTDVALNSQVSQLFDDFVALRAGSIVGLVTRLDSAITAGTLDVTVAINGVPVTLSVAHSSVANAEGGSAIQAAGVDGFVAGDKISVSITTNGTFAPNTASLEAWVEISIS